MSSDTDPPVAATPGSVDIRPARTAAGEGSATPSHPPAAAPRPSLVMRLAGLLKREPVLVVTLFYALVSFMGMWSNYWFYRRLGVPILEYLQGSDLFLIGLRRPDYFVVVLVVLAFVGLVGLPMRWMQRNPHKAQALRARRPFLHWFLTGGRWLQGKRIPPETQMACFGLLLSLQYLWVWSVAGAVEVLDGEWDGQQVRLTLAGDAAPLPGEARLLGTTSAYVLLWRPVDRRVEILPVANVARIQSLLPVRERSRRQAPPGAGHGAPAGGDAAPGPGSGPGAVEPGVAP